MNLIAASTPPPASTAQSIIVGILLIVVCLSVVYVRLQGGAQARKDADRLQVEVDELKAELRTERARARIRHAQDAAA